MSNIIQLNEEAIKNKLGELVRGTVEDTLNTHPYYTGSVRPGINFPG